MQVLSTVQRAPVAEAHPVIAWCTSLIATLTLEFDAAQFLCDLHKSGLGGVLTQNPDHHAVWTASIERVAAELRASLLMAMAWSVGGGLVPRLARAQGNVKI